MTIDQYIAQRLPAGDNCLSTIEHILTPMCRPQSSGVTLHRSSIKACRNLDKVSSLVQDFPKEH